MLDNLGLQYSGNKTVLERTLQLCYQMQNEIPLSLKTKALYFHLHCAGMQTSIHTLPNEWQRIVFIDDTRILMKKHAQRDILQKVIRAVAIVSPPPPLVYSKIICVCLQMALLTEIPLQV